MSREEGGECRTARHGLQCCTARHGLRYRTSRHGLLKMVPYMNVALVRAYLSRNLWGNAPPRRTAATLRAAGEPDLLPDVVVYAGGALFLAAASGVVFPSCSRGWAAGGAIPAVVTVEMAAGTAAAAAVAILTTVATSPRLAGAAAHGASPASRPACDQAYVRRPHVPAPEQRDHELGRLGFVAAQVRRDRTQAPARQRAQWWRQGSAECICTPALRYRTATEALPTQLSGPGKSTVPAAGAMRRRASARSAPSPRP